MKKEINYRILIIVSCMNWVITAVVIMLAFLNPKEMPYEIGEFMGSYISYSFVPSLLCLILAIKVPKDRRAVIIVLNIVFLVLYTLVFLFSRYMSTYG